MNNLFGPAIYKGRIKELTQKIISWTKALVQKWRPSDDENKEICTNEADLPLSTNVRTKCSPTYEFPKYLTSLLLHFGLTESYIKDSRHFISKFKNVILEENYILVIFNVVPIFTKALLDNAFHYVRQIFQEDITILYEQI